MKSNAELLTVASEPSFAPIIIHGEPSGAEKAPRSLTSLESLQIALAFIVGSAIGIFTLLL